MRIQIKEKVERGDVMAAIEMCNDLNPEVCELFYYNPFPEDYTIHAPLSHPSVGAMRTT
jgi:hypothetical protein